MCSKNILKSDAFTKKGLIKNIALWSDMAKSQDITQTNAKLNY